MSAKPMVKLDWCSYAAAKYAVEHWHYSKVVPPQPSVKIGVWENQAFIGAIVFGHGVSHQLLSPYGLSCFDGCELTRIALKVHATPVSRLIHIALRLLHTACPRLRLVISFADPRQGHVGAVYQASNWLYLGTTSPGDEYIVHGKRFQGRALQATRSTHRWRTVSAANVLGWAQQVLDPSAIKVRGSAKYRYAWPLDTAMRAQIAPLAQPYPKRATSILADASPVQGEESGAAPTVALRG